MPFLAVIWLLKGKGTLSIPFNFADRFLPHYKEMLEAPSRGLFCVVYH